MPYRVEIAPRAQRDLRRLPARDQQRLRSVILGLADTPRPSGVRKLAGRERSYRLRVGAYRVIYDNRLLVLVLQATRRSESTYRDV